MDKMFNMHRTLGFCNALVFMILNYLAIYSNSLPLGVRSRGGSFTATNGMVGIIKASYFSKTSSYAFLSVGLQFIALATIWLPGIYQK